jgi:hypothetical protein
MAIDMRAALLAGLLGGVATTVLGVIARALGIPVALETMLGTVFGLHPSLTASAIGFAIHLAVSAVVAVVYAAGFEYVTRRAGAGPGVLFSLVHTAMSGLALGAVPAVHPLIPEPIPAPGLFLSGLGAVGVSYFVAMHLLYGAVVGGVYGRRRQPGPVEVTQPPGSPKVGRVAAGPDPDVR